MFARLKECLKNWLVTHERLYWYIVVGLAVLAFGVITAMGMAKLEKAEAAQGVQSTIGGSVGVYEVPDLSEWSWDGWLQGEEATYYHEPGLIADNILNDFKYMVVFYADGVYSYYFGTDAFKLNITSTYKNYEYQPFGSFCYSTKTDYCVRVDVSSGNSVVSSVVGCWDLKDGSDNLSETFYMGYNLNLVGSNYDMFDGYTSDWAERLIPNVYYNNILFPIEEEVIEEGYDKLGFVPQITSGRHIGLGLWHYNYTPCIGSVNSSGETVIPNLRVSYRIKLPTVSLVQSWIDNGYTKNDFEKDDIVLWRNSGAGIRIEVMDFYSPIACDLGYFALNLKSDISNAWQFLYGDIDISALDMVYQFAFPDVVVTSAFYDEFGTSVYGPKLVQFASSFSSDAKEVYYYDEEYLYSGHCSSITQYLEAVNAKLEEEDNVEDWLKEETYKAALEENELLKKQVEELRKKLASVGSSDGGLWDTFDDIVESFKNASDSFVSIGHVIGNVFSFMPVEVTGMLIFVFTALLVLAVYWAVRGK